MKDQVEVYNIPSTYALPRFLHFLDNVLPNLEFNGDFPHHHPELIQENLGEIEEFARVRHYGDIALGIFADSESYCQSLHSEVLDPLFVLLAIALELPEDYFTNIHQYPVKSEVCAAISSEALLANRPHMMQDHFRYMKYSKYTEEENAKLKSGNWVPGHTG